MSVRGKEFIGLVSPQKERPKTGSFGGKSFIGQYIRDNFTISTWLCFGAVAQGLLFLAIGRPALIPAIVLLLYRTLDAYAMSIGLKHNKYMDGVILKKTSAQFPDDGGSYGNKPANNELVVFLIGTRCNHPLGVFGPGVQEFNQYFPMMAKYLNENAEDFGFLGMTSWFNSSDRSTNSEILQICYFKTVEGLHKYAHSDNHRKGWDWWNKNVKKYPHISIYHETYHVPKGNWESIYVNSHVSGINSTVHQYTDEMTGQPMYASPIVDASKGLLKTSAGRMSRSNATEHDNYGEDPY